MGPATSCPHVDLGTISTTVTYHGNTTGLPNWVESNRLEWRTAPEDSLTFIAGVAGNYRFDFTDQTTTNGGMGPSIRDAAGTLYASCPSSGTVANLDGIFESAGFPIALTQGQHVLVYVSAAYWSMPALYGQYTLTITKQ